MDCFAVFSAIADEIGPPAVDFSPVPPKLDRSLRFFRPRRRNWTARVDFFAGLDENWSAEATSLDFPLKKHIFSGVLFA